MVEVGEIEDLEVDPFGAEPAKRPMVSITSAGVPAAPLRQRVGLPTDRGRATAHLFLVAPQQTVCAAEKTSVAGSGRPLARVLTVRTLPRCRPEERHVVSAANRAASAGVRLVPPRR